VNRYYSIRELGMVTSTIPVVAPVGTVIFIADAAETVNVAGVPLNVTLIAVVSLVPRILTAAPALPEVGSVCTNGCRPMTSL